MEIRTAALDDLDTLTDIAAIVDPPADDAELDVSYYQHLLEHGRVVAAEASGIVIGYAATIGIDRSRHLSDLFLHQDARGQDIGRRLLDAVWEADAESAPRQTFSSVHPAALPLYIRAGMTPLWPLLYMSGSTSALRSSDLEVASIQPAEAARLEAGWLGWNRLTEYSYWQNRAGARIFAVRDGKTVVAVGCTARNRTMHTIGRLVCVEEWLLPDVLVAAARWCGDDVMVAVPGVNRALLMLVEAGWRIVEHDIYCASEPDLIDPGRLLPHPGLL